MEAWGTRLRGISQFQGLRQGWAWCAGGAEGRPARSEQSERGCLRSDAGSERKAGARSPGSLRFPPDVIGRH